MLLDREHSALSNGTNAAKGKEYDSNDNDGNGGYDCENYHNNLHGNLHGSSSGNEEGQAERNRVPR